MKVRSEVDWDAPIFLVGTSRCGSTLLTRLLNSHPRVALTDEAHLTHFLWLTHHLATLPAGKMEEMGPLRLLGFTPEPYIPLLSEIYRAHARELLQEAYSELFADKSFTRWGDKIRGSELVTELLATFPAAQVVHLIRDGRDQVASARDFHAARRAVSPDLPAVGFAEHCRYWVRVNEEIRAALLKHDRSIVVRYEELARQPARVAAQVLAFLRLSPRDADRETLDTAASERPTGHATSPGVEQSIGRWQRDLSESEKATADAIMGGLLAELEYS